MYTAAKVAIAPPTCPRAAAISQPDADACRIVIPQTYATSLCLSGHFLTPYSHSLTLTTLAVSHTHRHPVYQAIYRQGTCPTEGFQSRHIGCRRCALPKLKQIKAL